MSLSLKELFRYNFFRVTRFNLNIQKLKLYHANYKTNILKNLQRKQCNFLSFCLQVKKKKWGHHEFCIVLVQLPTLNSEVSVYSQFSVNQRARETETERKLRSF